MRTRPIAAASILLLTFGLASCTDDAQSSESGQSGQSGVATQSGTSSHSGQDSQSGSWAVPAPTSTVPPESSDQTPAVDPTAPAAPVDGAYPGAGGPIPAQATQLAPNTTSTKGYEGVYLTSPSGNVRCVLVEAVGYAGCGSDEIGRTGALGRDTTRPNIPDTDTAPVIEFASFGEVKEALVNGELGTLPLDYPILISQHEMPLGFFEGDNGKPYTVEYGQTVQYGRFACASETNGMTCWNSNTGHGAFLNKTTIEVF